VGRRLLSLVVPGVRVLSCHARWEEQGRRSAGDVERMGKVQEKKKVAVKGAVKVAVKGAVKVKVEVRGYPFIYRARLWSEHPEACCSLEGTHLCGVTCPSPGWSTGSDRGEAWLALRSEHCETWNCERESLVFRQMHRIVVQCGSFRTPRRLPLSQLSFEIRLSMHRGARSLRRQRWQQMRHPQEVMARVLVVKCTLSGWLLLLSLQLPIQGLAIELFIRLLVQLVMGLRMTGALPARTM